MCHSRPEKRPQRADPAAVPALDQLMGLYKQIHTNDRRSTAAGHWINEAFVVRLWAVLEADHVVDGSKPIDRSLGRRYRGGPLPTTRAQDRP